MYVSPDLTLVGTIRGGGSAAEVRAALQPWLDEALSENPESDGDGFSWGGAWLTIAPADEGLDVVVGSGGEDGYDSLEDMVDKVEAAVASVLPESSVSWDQVVEAQPDRR